MMRLQAYSIPRSTGSGHPGRGGIYTVRRALWLTTLMLLFAVVCTCMPMVLHAEDVFEGQWFRQPCSVLEEGGQTLLAIQVSAYRYAPGAWRDALSQAEQTEAAYLSSPEQVVVAAFEAQGVTDPTAFHTKFIWDKQVVFMIEVDQGDAYAYIPVVLEQRGTVYAISDTVTLDSCFMISLSGHPFCGGSPTQRLPGGRYAWTRRDRPPRW